MPPIKKPKRERQRTYFREWRERAGLTQAEAESVLGWSQSKISRIENGQTPYNQDDLEAAAAAFGCLTGEILLVNPHEADDYLTLLGRAARTDEDKRGQIASFLKYVLGSA